MNLFPQLLSLSLNGDLRRGGYQITCRVDGDTDAVVGDADSGHDNIRLDGRSLAGFIDPQAREWFNGHVIATPDYQFDRYKSMAQIQLGTVDNLLAGERVQDISFAVAASPANSHEATSWNFGKVVKHILQSHTNYIYDATGAAGSPNGIVTETDIDITNSYTISDAGAFFIVRKSDNLWRTLQSLSGGAEGGVEFYDIWVNRHNKIIRQQTPPFISPQPAARGTLDDGLIRGTVQVQLHNSQPGQRIGQVQISAAKHTGVSATYYEASYPSTPGNGAIYQKTSGIWAQSQTRANTLAERLYRWLTRLYTLRIEVDAGLILFGDDGNGVDLGDRVLVTYSGPAADAITGNGVHLNISSQSFFVYGVEIRFDVERAQAFLTLEHDNS